MITSSSYFDIELTHDHAQPHLWEASEAVGAYTVRFISNLQQGLLGVGPQDGAEYRDWLHPAEPHR